MHVSEPAHALRWVHDAIDRQDAKTFCTMALGRLDCNTEPHELTMALAGHPRGVLVDPQEGASHIGTHGTLLGMVEPWFVQTDHVVRPGQMLVFYTDGITDARPGEAMLEDELAEWLSAHVDDPLADIGPALLDELRGRRPQGLRDDVALVLLRRTTD
jgi:sigma-B regulation protein RsbU (phosphoserine phosphatase)